jgi:flagella synthesis protein FlgN
MATGTFERLSLEYAEAVALLKILDAEQAALISADLDTLMELGGAKEVAVTRLAALTSARHADMTSLGLPFSDAGVLTWLANTNVQGRNEGSQASSDALWRDVLITTAAAKERNRVNGLLIGRHTKNTQMALQALNAGRKSNDVYGPDGQTKSRIPSRTLVVG